MATAVDDIATYLGSLGTVGLYDPTGTTGSIYAYTVPDAPYSMLAVLFTPVPGLSGPYLFDEALPVWETVTVQIQSRDPDPTVAYNRVYAAYKALAAITDKPLGTTHYFTVRPLSPGMLPRDDNNLYLGVCTVKCTRAIP